jgi:hypothetical protein
LGIKFSNDFILVELHFVFDIHSIVACIFMVLNLQLFGLQCQVNHHHHWLLVMWLVESFFMFLNFHFAFVSSWMKGMSSFFSLEYCVWLNSTLYYASGVKARLGYSLRNIKDSFLHIQIHLFFHFSYDMSSISPFFLMSNEIILFQILYMHIEYLFFSLMKIKILKFIQCGPCSINGQNSQNFHFLKLFILQ